jgi:hypothetical protein
MRQFQSLANALSKEEAQVSTNKIAAQFFQLTLNQK